MKLLDALIIASGGFVGTLIRYELAKRLNGKEYPYGTLTVNLAGCFLIGIVMSLDIRPELTFFLIFGLAGALTTYSTWIKEVIELTRNHMYKKAFYHFGGAVALGLLCVIAGVSFVSFVL